MISRERIQQLHDQYLALVKLEVEEFGVKATEVRHLIGRLGEFHCALAVDGTLSHTANQVGFDVVCKAGRRISVKTTAQKTGFVAISKSTMHLADDLMVIQYADGMLTTLYYGLMGNVVGLARDYHDLPRYELDISVARRVGILMQQSKSIDQNRP